MNGDELVNKTNQAVNETHENASNIDQSTGVACNSTYATKLSPLLNSSFVVNDGTSTSKVHLYYI